MLTAIVAVDENWGIGYKGDLLLSIPDDLKRFKELTVGKTVVMGRNTWDSLPRKPLPNRINIVIRTGDTIETDENSVIRMDLDTFLRIEKAETIVMGGASIYKQLLPYCDKIYITKIYKSFENVDTFFPNLDDTNEWTCSPVGDVREYNGVLYQYWEYDRLG